jgi:low temperature requirement protein LtrA
MSATILTAFEDRGEGFAVAYVCLQALRAGFMVWAFGWESNMGRNYAQLLVWAWIAGALWIAGGLVHDPDTRLILWALAVALDYGVPLLGFRLPRVGPIAIDDWLFAGAHLAERCEQVLMIAFGETLLRIGEAYTQHRGTTGVDAAFIVGFILIITLWSIYFLHRAPHGVVTVEDSEVNSARIGQSVYTYGHAVMVGAVIVIADAVHLAVAGPGQSVTVGFSIVCLGGPAAYLLGIAMTKHWLGHGRSGPPLVGTAALLVLGIPAAFGTRLTELIAATIVASALALVAGRDSVTATVAA